MMKPKIKIYSGLALSKNQLREAFPAAEFAYLAKRNTLYKDIKDGVHIVGILDGEYVNGLSVSPTEIMDALRCGLKVYGAAGIGALRAAELNAFGMKGCGRIYEYIKSSNYFADDHIGQNYWNAEISTDAVPFLDIKLSLDELVSQKKVTPKESKKILGHYQDLHFSRRSISILKKNLGSSFDSKRLNSILTQLKNVRFHDGLQMVQKIQYDLNEKWKVEEKFKYELSNT
jgi:hypothetical protein